MHDGSTLAVNGDQWEFSNSDYGTMTSNEDVLTKLPANLGTWDYVPNEGSSSTMDIRVICSDAATPTST